MRDIDFKFLNSFFNSIVVTDGEKRLCFHNNAFKDEFGVVKSVKNLTYLFDIDVCPLDSDNISMLNPISLAIKSKEAFACVVTCNKNNEKYYLNSFCYHGYKVLIFQSYSQNMFLMSKKLEKLEQENKLYTELKQKAQFQAIKTGLLNRIYTIVQSETSLNKLLKAIFNELFEVIGVEELFYAEKNKKTFSVKYNFSSGKSEKKVTDYTFEKNKLSTKKEYLNDKKVLYTKITVPIKDRAKVMGLLIFCLKNKKFLLLDEDFLNSLCSELSGAILQVILYQQIKDNNKILKNTLTELKQTQLQLINSEKMATLGTLIAGVTHEINTPLASISSNNEILIKLAENELKKENPNKIFELYEKALNTDKEAIKRITYIVKTLKKFVRLDEAQMQQTEINQELDLTLDLVQHLTKNKIEIIKNYSDLPPIYTHTNLLNQVFMNIIVNAIQSIENKGHITISTHEEDLNIQISIKDDGCGMSKEVQKKIFNQGFTTKYSTLGTGLGLSISKKIMEKLNGEISFTSEVNKGTEFIIRLPKEKDLS